MAPSAVSVYGSVNPVLSKCKRGKRRTGEEILLNTLTLELQPDRCTKSDGKKRIIIQGTRKNIRRRDR